jgi:hypothetical protein
MRASRGSFRGLLGAGLILRLILPAGVPNNAVIFAVFHEGQVQPDAIVPSAVGSLARPDLFHLVRYPARRDSGKRGGPCGRPIATVFVSKIDHMPDPDMAC